MPSPVWGPGVMPGKILKSLHAYFGAFWCRLSNFGGTKRYYSPTIFIGGDPLAPGIDTSWFMA